MRESGGFDYRKSWLRCISLVQRCMHNHLYLSVWLISEWNVWLNVRFDWLFDDLNVAFVCFTFLSFRSIESLKLPNQTRWFESKAPNRRFRIWISTFRGSNRWWILIYRTFTGWQTQCQNARIWHLTPNRWFRFQWFQWFQLYRWWRFRISYRHVLNYESHEVIYFTIQHGYDVRMRSNSKRRKQIFFKGSTDCQISEITTIFDPSEQLSDSLVLT